MQRLCKQENVEVSWMCRCRSSGPSFAPGWGKAALSQITWCRWTDSFPSAMERPVFRQGHSPEPWTVLSGWPLWRSLSLPSVWPEKLRHLRYHRASSCQIQLLWLRRETSIELDPALARGMVSGYPFTTSNSFHLRLPRTIPRTYPTREDELIWLL